MFASAAHAKIPHVVHQIQWENAEAPTPIWCSIASWRCFAAKHHWRHRRWTRAELVRQFDPEVWQWLTNQKVRGLHSLIASYQILHSHGGLIVDTSLIWLGAMISRDRVHPPTSFLLDLVSHHEAVVLPSLPIDNNDIAFVLESSLLAAPPGHAGLGRVLNQVRQLALNASQAPSRKRKAVDLPQAQLALDAIRGTQTTPDVGRLPSSALVYALAQSSSDGSHMAAPSSARTVFAPTMSNVTMRHLAWVQPPEWILGGVPWRYGSASGINIRAQPHDPSGVSQCMLGSKGWVLFHPPMQPLGQTRNPDAHEATMSNTSPHRGHHGTPSEFMATMAACDDPFSALQPTLAAAGFQGSFFLRSSASFTDALGAAHNGWCTQHGPSLPGAIALPLQVRDVALLVRVITAAIPDVHLAVRGRGHSYLCQSLGPLGRNGSTTLLVDLIHLQVLSVGPSLSATTTAVTVGAGVDWTTATQFMDSAGVHSIHGDCGSVGVVGCCLHGCIELTGLSAKYGMCVDNLLSLTAVLVDGRVVNVTATRALEQHVETHIPIVRTAHLPPAIEALHDDLWFALRGAGSSIAIVTSIAFRAWMGAEPQLWATQLAPPPAAESAASGANGFADSMRMLRALPAEWSGTLWLDCTAGAPRSRLWSTLLIRYVGDSASPARLEIDAKISTLLPNARTQPHARMQEHGDVYGRVWGRGNGSKQRAFFSDASAVHHSPRRSLLGPPHLSPKSQPQTPDLSHIHTNTFRWQVISPAASDRLSQLGRFAAAVEHVCADVGNHSLDGGLLSHGAICDGCWGVISRVGERQRAAARAAGTSLSAVRDEAELFVEVDCGSSRADAWSACDSALRRIQETLDEVAGPADAWHYPNIPNIYSSDWARYHWGGHYERLRQIKARLDPMGRLAFLQSVPSER